MRIRFKMFYNLEGNRVRSNMHPEKIATNFLLFCKRCKGYKWSENFWPNEVTSKFLDPLPLCTSRLTRVRSLVNWVFGDHLVNP